MFEHLLAILGIERQSVSHLERLISGVGALLAILFIYTCSKYFLDQFATLLIIASMGASAVLLFAVPHGALSQPWAVIAGHTVSALIGVSCALFISSQVFAAAAAVGLAVTVMYYLRCIHPPGGATALTAVIGGESVHQLGFSYAVAPILLNAVSIVIFAMLFNALFEWRRYPAYINKMKNRRQRQLNQKNEAFSSAIAHEDFVYALSEIGTFIDVDESDLLRIYDLATSKVAANAAQNTVLLKGGYYSNGEFGELWSVREITDIESSADESESQIFFKVVAGHGRRQSGVATRHEFLKWAAYEVYRDEDNWRRLDPRSK